VIVNVEEDPAWRRRLSDPAMTTAVVCRPFVCVMSVES
jgi:hypothetical protein